ncbi:DNA breaking-rejoining protein [Thiorhodococcus minor]|uniref:DNA breaking-rejoining protein n=1 Tax=Thiorhodococcus minor TaxID=57489 RepID=A0A6M0K895_9GAMM|nr:DNA breaking-rejoining protein [Thiorhodococcus minor]NEV64625.1 DNA breaking-rejoining protein [Thiorhodococcus minor]
MKAAAALIGAALLASTTAMAGDIRTERVHFKKGASSATVEDSIKGYQGVDYVLGARKGQSMNVSMATNNTANYFNILAPGKTDEAMFIGSTSGNQFEGTLPASGDYKIRVYLMRSAARRDEVADYRLEMIID